MLLIVMNAIWILTGTLAAFHVVLNFYNNRKITRNALDSLAWFIISLIGLWFVNQ